MLDEFQIGRYSMKWNNIYIPAVFKIGKTRSFLLAFKCTWLKRSADNRCQTLAKLHSWLCYLSHTNDYNTILTPRDVRFAITLNIILTMSSSYIYIYDNRIVREWSKGILAECNVGSINKKQCMDWDCERLLVFSWELIWEYISRIMKLRGK